VFAGADVLAGPGTCCCLIYSASVKMCSFGHSLYAYKQNSVYAVHALLGAACDPLLLGRLMDEYTTEWALRPQEYTGVSSHY
jgi:hypothetical protein